MTQYGASPQRRATAVAMTAAGLTVLGLVVGFVPRVPDWAWRGALIGALVAWVALAALWRPLVGAMTSAGVEARYRHRRYRQLVATAKEGVVTIDTDRAISVVNQQAADMLGYSVDEVVAQRDSHFADAGADGGADGGAEASAAAGTGERELTLRRKDGSAVSVLLNESPLLDADGQYAGQLGLITDLSERNGLEDELAFHLFHDPLTALPNHLLLVDRLDAALELASAGATGVAVVVVDVDGMTDVNNTQGHGGGDQVLVELAGRLAGAVPERDTVARSGGDTFVVVAEATGLLFAEGLADRLRNTLNQPCTVGGAPVDVTTSMGVAVGQYGDLPGTLLRGADLALRQAKSLGRGRTEFFTQELRASTKERLELVAELRHAVDRGELSMRYQPVVSLDEGGIVGAEALVRWEHPRRGTLSPAVFIPLAEETGFIDRIGAWVIEETSRQLASWERLRPDLSMSLNVSARQFGAGVLHEIVRAAVDATGVDPRHLALEITEAALMDDVDLSVRVLDDLRATGVRISIDDFGTGYSSLARLNRFPIDVLKIDQSFVAGLPDDTYDVAIVEAVLAIASSLNLSVIAEGVENAAQARTLRELGCRCAQGYAFFRPLTAERFEAELAYALSA
jgi:diguanylate cyclase (GGDEF)-like protein/PAS domain S-box-containing protein